MGRSGSAAADAAAIPKFAQEIAAAIALVDGGDVLTEDVDLSNLAERRRRSVQRNADVNAAAAAAAAASSAPSSPAAAQPGTASTSSLAANAGGESSGAAPEPPSGPPPLLAAGADDVYWVSKLHAALEVACCYPPDDELEDFYFGEGTQAALLSYQACNGLDETGARLACWAFGAGVGLMPVCGLAVCTWLILLSPAAAHQ